jgi:hypothetical protein
MQEVLVDERDWSFVEIQLDVVLEISKELKEQIIWLEFYDVEVGQDRVVF